MLVLPALEAVLGADVVDDGPTTIFETDDVAETCFVAETTAVDVAVFRVLWGVPALVLIVIEADGHVVSYAKNENP